MNCDQSSDYFVQHGHCPVPSHLWAYIALFIVGLLVLCLVLSAFRVVQAYERGVVFRFGRVVGERGPGLQLVVPLIDRLVRVSMQVTTLPLEAQQVISKDSVSLSIRAVVFFRVVNATKSEVEIEGFEEAIEQYGLSLIRKIIGQHDLHDVLHGERTITEDLTSELDAITEEWGVQVSKLEIKDIDLPENMRRAMASEAEARREAAAKIIGAQGEKDSAELLFEAATALDDRAMRLRELQVMREIGADNATIVVVPNGGFGGMAGAAAAGGVAAGQAK